MTSLQISFICLSSSFSLKRTHATNVPKFRRMPLLVPKISIKKSFHESNNSRDTNPLEVNVTQKILHDEDIHNLNILNTKTRIYSILELVTDRVEMHHNVGEQRDNWNTLLLNSINMITLTATTMSGLAAACPGSGAPPLSLKLSSTLLFCAATGLLLVMNKIQPSQLAEEQRNATRLFKCLNTKIETTIALRNPTEEDVNDMIEKVLALDRAYPLPLLGGAMLEKFPEKFEPVVWWPNNKTSQPHEGKAKSEKMEQELMNGWSEELEMELREVVEVTKRKDFEDYERLGNMALKINKSLAIIGPLLMGIATIGSVFVDNIGSSSWAYLVTLLAGSSAAVVNSFEHGGQVGMVFEMYRYCGGFLRLLEETVEATLEEKDVEKRENGEVFENKVAMQLGRNGLQLRELASKSASYRRDGIAMDEFASKLF
ncbi:hypothetical protein GLYMA_09G006700v4 [Glycine max]|uniref:F-box protein n=1 Tax=Glycine max TaxID=3847 RepID=I1KZV6_SOYBN|nr:probable F-box protein At4g22030 [Glycine max]KRH36496.1 hypothetical protein GLYMA_09G006700v4 [Glycine max]|eukprot:XP_003534720.2 probable F-box protein At4g22030 [Glycine max]